MPTKRKKPLVSSRSPSSHLSAATLTHGEQALATRRHMTGTAAAMLDDNHRLLTASRKTKRRLAKDRKHRSHPPIAAPNSLARGYHGQPFEPVPPKLAIDKVQFLRYNGS